MKPRQMTYFGDYFRTRWPSASSLEKEFFPAPGARWFTSGGNDTASFVLEGVDGTSHFDDVTRGRRDVSLSLLGHPLHGVFLLYKATRAAAYSSKGDMTKMRNFVRTLHGDLSPLGLFVPFETAWIAVKDFVEHDGLRSPKIAWVDNRTFDADTFPDPHATVGDGLKAGDTVIR
jgi:hypothetical protein